MSWSDRRSLIACLAATPALAACGFAPALAPGEPATALRGRIRADDPVDDATAALVARFEERLGRPTRPGWRLAYALTITESRRALEAVVGETRGQFDGTLRWQLVPEDGETPVAEGTARRFTGFSRTDTPLARRAAAEDAARRLGRMLADAVVAELVASAGDWAVATP